MHGVIKERMFSNFIKEDTRISPDSYRKIGKINHKIMSLKRYTKTRSGSSPFRTIQQDQNRTAFSNHFFTIDMKQNSNVLHPATIQHPNSTRSKLFSIKTKKLQPAKEPESERSPFFSIERTTTKEIKL